MSVKINIDGKEEEIKILPLKGRHADKGFKLFVSLADEDNVHTDKLVDYFDYLDNLASELTGMSLEKLNDLPEVEKQKIVAVVQKQIEGKVDFLKSSLKSVGSAPTDTPRS